VELSDDGSSKKKRQPNLYHSELVNDANLSRGSCEATLRKPLQKFHESGERI
jgi:hypothetical protein